MSINFTNTWSNNNQSSDGNNVVYSAVNSLANTSSDYSFSFWFKTSLIGGKFIGSENWNPGSGLGGSYDRQVYMDDNGYIAFGVYSGSTYIIRSPTNTYNDGKWHHCIATQSSTTGMRIMVDGGTPVTNGQTAAENGSGRRWIVGGGNIDYWSGISGSSVFKVRGAMQDVRVYSRSLSVNEMITIANSYGKDNIKEDIFFRWMFGNGIGNYPTSVVKDFSGNGTDGTIYIPSTTVPTYDDDIVSSTRRVA